MSEIMKRITGAEAAKAMETAKKKFGNPFATDAQTTLPKLPLKPNEYYNVLECPKCHGKMYPVYYNINRTRYMCSLCGYKQG